MNIWLIVAIVCGIIGLVGLVVGLVSRWNLGWDIFLAFIGSLLCFGFSAVGISTIVSVKSEGIRQLKEREQIVYQIEHLTEDSDKIKLNEWILTYNDWVNDVNTSKELYGWFSWYRDLDMSKHTIINLV